MAFAQDIRNIEGGISHRVSSFVKGVAARYAQHRLERQTFRELSALSDRELDDLGLNRSMLHAVAFEATHDK